MIDCKFKAFNESLEFFDNDLKSVHFDYVLVDPKQNSWVFNLTLDKIVSPKKLFPYLEALKKHFHDDKLTKKVDTKIRYLDLSNINEHILDTYQAVLNEVCKNKPSCQAFLNYTIKYDENIKILVDKESTFLRKDLEVIETYLAKYGLAVKVELEIDEELTPLTKALEEKIKETNKVAAKQAEILEKELKMENNPTKFTTKSSPKAVKINTIPMDQYQIDQYMATEGDVNFIIEGEVISHDMKKFTNSTLLTLTVADKEDAIICKRFINREKDIELASTIKEGTLVQITGKAKFDTFIRDVVIEIDKFFILDSAKGLEREDKSKEKRVELHAHTKMSNMDAVVDVSDYINQAIKWGHKAIAFTDHNSLNAYPDIHKAIKGKDIKPIFGVELDFLDDASFKLTSDSDTDILLKDATYIVFDIETTGFSTTRDKIIEIGALKLEGMEVVDKFQTFINPMVPLSETTTSLTSITNEDVEGAPTIDKIMPQFLDFIGDSILVAHNASFDVGHIKENARLLGLEYKNNKVIDTLNLARYFYQGEMKNFRLDTVAKYFKIKLEHHHRAEDDALTTSKIWISIQSDLAQKGIKNYLDINKAIDPNEAYKFIYPYHVNVLVKNETGLHNLYRIISDALTTHFYKGARTLKSVFEKHKEGLLIGSGCYKGDVFELALNKSDDELIEAIKYYDYIEVQHPNCYRHLFEGLGDNGKEIIEGVIHKIIRLAKQEGKIVVATGDTHYMNKEDRIYREIFIRAKQVGGGLHPLARATELPDQHFLTTEEMLKEMSFLGNELAKEIVVTNTNIIADKIEKIQVFKKDLYSILDDAFKDTLGIPSIKEEVKQLVAKKVHSIYGENPHFIVKERIEKELNSIIKNEFAPIYYMSHLLVKRSLEDGYLVGSRGSVGSSFVATMLEITEVNPLRPHYTCPKCQFTAFKLTKEEELTHVVSDHERSLYSNFNGIKSGFDLKNEVCPVCNFELKKDGHDIPFETFLGLEGNKIPDIDLNFSGDYQGKAHSYVRELLGEDFTFRAGTIQTVQEKNAFGYVKGFFEDNMQVVRNAQINRLATKIQGVKRSTGQHPGGIVVVPKNHTIYDVTPVQYPADDIDSTWKTTHYDYHSFEDNLLKLDILGHDDPTMIKFLMDYVHANPLEFSFNRAQDIPVDDSRVYRLFSGMDVLGIKKEDFELNIASSAVPEFGTQFTKQMLYETKPNSFAGLVKISGLSHGTDVWLKNSQMLVNGHPDFGTISFDDIIGCRDDIMIQLEAYGIESKMAFEIMEFVRKGNPSKNKAKWLDYETIMREHKVPEWYIWSASQIKYMFPKAHAVAYVLMAMRIAWFKIYKPLLFYSGFFSKRVDQFDYDSMVAGTNAVRNQLKIINSKAKNDKKVKDESLIVTLTVALEMNKRGFKFLPIDLHKSEALEFKMEGDALRMPFITLDGLGDAVAIDIVEKRNEKEFTSIKDIQERTRINKTILEKMKNYGILDEFPDENDEIEQGLFALD
ncbi:PolC-type DNA polymerase III [Acholeplasma sp. OttesenSCG-928-E16]|nr:PolC-type DNA polymerase III [Acholeplasma sp. OttesenSCG-928-E16]